jgi:DNA-binding transcriptional MocR family regulator
MAKRAQAFAWHSISLEHFSGPLHRKLYLATREQILRGDLGRGQRLPSSRVLAKLLGLSRNTVLRVYDRLADEGYVTARVGCGTHVKSALTCVQERSLLVRAERTKRTGKLGEVFRKSHYPVRSATFQDCNGNLLYLYDSRQSLSIP